MELKLHNLDHYDFLEKKHEINEYGGTGDNVSPQLYWRDIPSGTNSLAITVFDPDAPTGSGFWHWVAFDIPPTTHELPAGAGSVSHSLVPGMKQAISDFGLPGYGGACPPEGDRPHRYVFTLHALKCAQLGVDPSMPNAIIRFMINAAIIASSSVTVLYQR